MKRSSLQFKNQVKNLFCKTMKLLTFLVASVLVAPPAFADYRQGGGVQETKCYNTVYREEYIPGTRTNPGRVRRWNEQVETACENQVRIQPYPQPTQSNVDDNSCIEGSILGGIAGGAAGGVLSTQENWIWSIPTGIIGGALIGCQADGG